MTAITAVFFLHFMAKSNNMAFNGKKYVTKKQPIKLQLTLVYFPFTFMYLQNQLFIVHE